MNLLFINSAKEWGGTEKWALGTASGLADAGHTVYFGCRGGLFHGRPRSDKLVLVRFPLANNFDLLSIIKLCVFMRKKNIDAVLPSKQREYLLAGIAAKLTPRTKVIGMFGIDRPLHNARNRFAFCKLFDMVFVVAKMIIPVLGRTKAFDTGKCRVVYVGVEPIPRSAEARRKYRNELGLQEDDIAIMGIGRLAPQKGFDYAIKGLSLVKTRLPRIKLVLVGGGDRTLLKKLRIVEGVADDTIFTGYREDVHGLLQAADIFWLTSRSEGIPNTMLEAMSACIPVVSFDISGVAEVLKNKVNGLLVPFEDIQALADATEYLVQNQSFKNCLAEEGRKSVLERFSLQKMCADTEKYLRELLI